METYNLVTEWFFQSPIERVWEEAADMQSHPACGLNKEEHL